MNEFSFGTNNIKKDINDKNYTALRISLASPEEIRAKSNGEVKKPETINYRTHKPEPDGLFCAKIFGPVKDYTCLCAKYKKRKYEGLTCEKCGVKITSSSVRRSWTGHIELASPVIHTWFFKTPSKIGNLLNYTNVEVSKLLYEDFYAVINSGYTKLLRADDILPEGFIVTEDQYVVIDDYLREFFENIDDSIIDSIISGSSYVIIDPEGTPHKKGTIISDEEFTQLEQLMIAAGDSTSGKTITFTAETGETGVNFLINYLQDFYNDIDQFRVLVEYFYNGDSKDELLDAELEILPKNFISSKDIIDLLFKKAYFITSTSNENLKVGDILATSEYKALSGDDSQFEASTGVDFIREILDQFSVDRGAEALQKLLLNLKLKFLSDGLRAQLKRETSETKKKKYSQRLKIVESFYLSGNKPEWMILEVIPVLPPDLRPLVPLEGGRFATSDLNDLYRRIITRNNRLKKLIEIGAPSIIVRNEKRMLQEAVDALFDNSSMSKPAKSNNGRPLKSLTDALKGKHGRFRQHLLGKRVDYSGRSVITVGPQLKLHQCGLPKKMALELFKPFIFNKLIERGFVTNVKSAKKKVEDQEEIVFEILEDIVREHPILLNRAPTLHRLGIQAFEPILVEGKSIQLHPLVCVAFNADFDGDQMAVHLPLSIEAQIEARVLMMSTNNILSPASGKPIIGPTQDMVLGLYYITRERYFRKGGGFLPFVPNIDERHKVREGEKEVEKYIYSSVEEGLKHFNLHHLIPKLKNKDTTFNSHEDAFIAYKLSQQGRLRTKYSAINPNDNLTIIIGKNKEQFTSIRLEHYLFKKSGGIIFSSPEEVTIALAHKKVDLHSKVKVKMKRKLVTDFVKGDHQYIFVDTTPGRMLFWEITPKSNDPENKGKGLKFNDINKVLGKKQLNELLHKSFVEVGPKATVLFADNMKNLGFKQATSSGISIGINDMIIPETKKIILAEAQKRMDEFKHDYDEMLLSETEYINKTKELWERTTQRVANSITDYIQKVDVVDPKTGEVIRDKNGKILEEESFNSIYVMKDSGARGSDNQIKQLSGMRGLMSKPNGDIIATPIKANFREGLSVLEYFTSTHGARKGLSDTALKTSSSGYLTRKLVDVAHDAIVTSYDCGTITGLEIDIDETDDKYEFVDRILGRTSLEDIKNSQGEIIVNKGDEIDEVVVEDILANGIETVKIRSVLTCKSRKGVCRKCYGRDLSRGELVNIGESIGVIAAQSIGEPGTQLTMRTFHAGGIASGGDVDYVYKAKAAGKVIFDRIATIQNKDGIDIVVTRNGNIRLIDKNGREKDVINVEYGSKIFVKDNEEVGKEQKILEWDPHSKLIISEVAGRIKFVDLIQDVTFREDTSQVKGDTGIETSVRKITDYKGKKEYKPSIQIVDENGEPIKVRTRRDKDEYAIYPLTKDFELQSQIKDGQMIDVGITLASKPKTQKKNEDIVSGLPRVEELFEARKPKLIALVSEIDGVVEFGAATKTKQKLKIKPEIGKIKNYEFPRTKEPVVKDGDFIRAGEKITEGDINPHDILKIKGEKELSKFLVKEIQKVYKSQGVAINDKHIEVIVRQMLKKVQITTTGDSLFLMEESIDKFRFEDEKIKLLKKRKKPATAKPLLLGISRAALTTESFISAASFQETTKVLTDASIKGKIDHLLGLKENVIMGRLIPAGTGIENYSKLEMEIVRHEDDII